MNAGWAISTSTPLDDLRDAASRIRNHSGRDTVKPDLCMTGAQAIEAFKLGFLSPKSEVNLFLPSNADCEKVQKYLDSLSRPAYCAQAVLSNSVHKCWP